MAGSIRHVRSAAADRSSGSVLVGAGPSVVVVGAGPGVSVVVLLLVPSRRNQNPLPRSAACHSAGSNQDYSGYTYN